MNVLIELFLFKKLDNKGFSLIELSLIISIVATSLVGFLYWTQPATITDSNKYIETRQKMEAIDRAIKNFRVQYGRLPCPADPFIRINNSYNSTAAGGADQYQNDFGIEDIDDSQADNTFGIDCPRSFGVVPVHSLNLGQEYIDDGWGRRLTYQISDKICSSDRGYTGTGGTPELNERETIESRAEGCTRNNYLYRNGNLTIKDGDQDEDGDDADDIITNVAAFVIISHGANGHGAFLPSGEQLPNSSDLDETDNSDHDNFFILKPNDEDYDDILYYKNKNQIEKIVNRSDIEQISVEECNINSEQISAIDKTAIIDLNNNLTQGNYSSYTDYNNGEQVALSVLMALQAICIKYYGDEPATIENVNWVGARCPGNALANPTNYNPKTGSCTCDDDSWDGTCEIDWFEEDNFQFSDNLAFWLDASSPLTIFSDNSCTIKSESGDLAMCWNDKSGNGLNFTVSNVIRSPTYNITNNFGALNFCSGCVLDTDYTYGVSNSYSIFAVTKPDTSSAHTELTLLRTSSYNYGVFYSLNSGNYFLKSQLSTISTQIDKAVNTSKTLISNRYNSDLRNLSLRLNGVLSSNTYAVNEPAATNDTNWKISRYNSGEGFVGNMYEILSYERALPDNEIVQIEEYLADKWGMSYLPNNTSPILWLDANDETDIYTDTACSNAVVASNNDISDNSDKIGCWANKVSNNNALQSSNSNKPIYREIYDDKKSVLFADSESNSNNSYLSHDSVAAEFDDEFTVFTVLKPLNSSSTRTLFSAYNGSSSNIFSLYSTYSANDLFTVFSDNFSGSPKNRNASSTQPYDNAGWLINSVLANITDDTLTSYVDGFQEVQETDYDSAGTANTFTIGATNVGGAFQDYYNGYISEIIIYPDILSEAKRENVELYLSEKWKIDLVK